MKTTTTKKRHIFIQYNFLSKSVKYFIGISKEYENYIQMDNLHTNKMPSNKQIMQKKSRKLAKYFIRNKIKTATIYRINIKGFLMGANEI